MLTIRLDIDGGKVELGNEEIGYATFEAENRDIVWARRLAEHLEEEGVDIDLEEK